ncbi:GTPase Era [Paludicola sp. MB14-C6]|uniref:GTPase Era n=1 Tax=Paludihabitans sp. MB14-C6 TaxID=3070656 RepID=UPI0027DAE972|nr:GTPase Era [Paludicola sp. MB14-C6]WMJ23407.1 GTPase Era [Paludicola sp. MB14-C6]
MEQQNTRSAFVAIVGKPNVGKSSLLNKLLGEKVAIVTNKPQTTRTKITGVLTKNEVQYVFIDTPGFHKAKTKLSDSMIKAVNTSIKDVDIVMMVVEPSGKLTQAELDLIENIKQQKIPSILIINKIDLISNKELLVARIEQIMQLHSFDAVIPISVQENNGVDLVLAELDKYAEEGVHFFPDDTLTDQPERVIVSEIIREKILLNLHQEIPHGTAVVIEKMREREGKDIMDIDAMIYCEKDSHKGMIIGKKGAVLKRIASTARTDIEEFLGVKINLQCWIKVREDWRNKESFIRNFGLSDN